jgi:FkbM family methyltransferase
MSTLLRQSTLKVLRLLGIKSFKARSGLGYPFLCHVGDFAGEAPFYNREYSRTEITFMARWCARYPQSIVFDVGANVGFVATQLAQTIKTLNCHIIAFEPVYQTFAKLKQSIQDLGLQSQIAPVCCVVSDCGGVCSVAFNSSESLFAQVRQDTLNSRAGNSLTWCPEVTLDSVVKALGGSPTLVKIDVEGHEAHVLRGARALLRGPDAPAICFELNPVTLREVGSSVDAVAAEMRGYRYFYLDDFEGQKIPLGKEIADIESLTWVCNLFAAPGRISESELLGLFE